MVDQIVNDMNGKCMLQTTVFDVDTAEEMVHTFATSMRGFDLDEFLNYYKCALNVMDNAVGESDLKQDYEKLKQNVNAVIENKLKFCRTSKNSYNKLLFV